MRIALPILLAVLLAVTAARADQVLHITITGGQEGAQPIAIAPFGWSGPGQPPQRIGQIIADDLARTGLFAPKPFADLPGRPTDPSQVNFHDFRLLGTANLVIGRLTADANGRYTIEAHLFDVFRAREMTVIHDQGTRAELRRKAHQFADIIYEKLTGQRGAFDTRIAYVSEVRKGPGNSVYTLNVADSDGYNQMPALRSKQPLLSPAWSPDGTRLAYVSMETGSPHLFIQRLSDGHREAVSTFPGLNNAPAWSPDGTRLALTLSKDGNAEIYILYLNGHRFQRMTVNDSIDTEPAWSPDGQTLIFTSQRGGHPNIYRMPVSGGEPQRVTFEGTYNARASFSPDGKRIVYVHSEHGNAFRIAVQDLQTNQVQVLTDGQLDESPSFAPNGSMILYATTGDQGSELAAVSVDGRVHQRLVADGTAVREPAWSPFRKP